MEGKIIEVKGCQLKIHIKNTAAILFYKRKIPTA